MTGGWRRMGMMMMMKEGDVMVKVGHWVRSGSTGALGFWECWTGWGLYLAQLVPTQRQLTYHYYVGPRCDGINSTWPFQDNTCTVDNDDGRHAHAQTTTCKARTV
jgi:hypothetical protein